MRIFSVDREALLQRLRAAVATLAEARPEIRRVILFGSLARDDYGPGSDADLAIILSASDKPMRERVPDYLDLARVVAVDVFPYTEAEFAARQTAGDPFVRKILSDGQALFVRAATRQS